MMKKAIPVQGHSKKGLQLKPGGKAPTRQEASPDRQKKGTNFLTNATVKGYGTKCRVWSLFIDTGKSMNKKEKVRGKVYQYRQKTITRPGTRRGEMWRVWTGTEGLRFKEVSLKKKKK